MLSITPSINRHDSTPVYLQLYTSIKREIEAGRLMKGERLPSIRELADYLAVSKNTISGAYQQLVAEGYAEARNTSRLVVTYQAEHFPASDQGSSLPLLTELAAPAYDSGQHEIPFDFISGPIDTGEFPIEAWRKCLLEALYSPSKDVLGYGEPQGDLQLREQLAAYLLQSRGISCSPTQIFLTAGTQHSISLLCQLLPLSGKNVAMEDPGFHGVRVVLQNHGCKVTSVPLEPGGLQVERLYASGSSAVYVTPSHQFPMGMVMPIQKRHALLQWAEQRNALIIEDDYDSEFRYQGEPIVAMKAIDTNDRVIYLGTMSKIFLPSARMSYMVIPRGLVHDLQSKMRHYNQAVSPLIQHAMHSFISNGYFEKHVRRMRRIYRHKYERLLASIHDHMGGKVQVVGQKAGLHLLLHIPGHDVRSLLAAAADAGVRVEPVSNHWAGEGPSPDHDLILGFGQMPAEQLEEGVRRLAEAWFGSSGD